MVVAVELIVDVAVKSNVTVPLLCVNVPPLLVKLPAKVKLALSEAKKVSPLPKVKLPLKSAFLSVVLKSTIAAPLPLMLKLLLTANDPDPLLWTC